MTKPLAVCIRSSELVKSWWSHRIVWIQLNQRRLLSKNRCDDCHNRLPHCHFQGHRHQFHSLAILIPKIFFAPLLCTIYPTIAALCVQKYRKFSIKLSFFKFQNKNKTSYTYIWIELIATILASLSLKIVICVKIFGIIYSNWIEKWFF